MPERNEYLDTMEDLVGHAGWRLLEEDFKHRIYEFQANALDKAVAKSWDDVNYLRGAAAQLAELLALPAILANLRQQQNEKQE